MLPGDLYCGFVNINSNNPDTTGPKNQCGQLPQEPHADDGARFTDTQIGLADPLHGNGTQRIVGSLAQVGITLQPNAETDRNGNNLGMGGGQTTAGHQITDSKTGHTVSHFYHFSGG